MISEKRREGRERKKKLLLKRVMVLIDRGLIENWVKFKVAAGGAAVAGTIDVDSSSSTVVCLSFSLLLI